MTRFFVLLFLMALNMHAMQQEKDACSVCAWREDLSTYSKEHFFNQEEDQNKPPFCCYPCCSSIKTITDGSLFGCQFESCEGCLGKLRCFCCPSCFCECSTFDFCECQQGTKSKLYYCALGYEDSACVWELSASACCSKQCFSMRCEPCQNLEKKDYCSTFMECVGECLMACCFASAQAIVGPD